VRDRLDSARGESGRHVTGQELLSGAQSPEGRVQVAERAAYLSAG